MVGRATCSGDLWALIGFPSHPHRGTTIVRPAQQRYDHMSPHAFGSGVTCVCRLMPNCTCSITRGHTQPSSDVGSRVPLPVQTSKALDGVLVTSPFGAWARYRIIFFALAPARPRRGLAGSGAMPHVRERAGSLLRHAMDRPGPPSAKADVPLEASRTSTRWTPSASVLDKRRARPGATTEGCFVWSATFLNLST